MPRDLFTYEDPAFPGVRKGLIGDVITGSGAAFSSPSLPGTLLISKADAVVSSRVAGLSTWAAYSNYFQRFYDEASIDRHINKLITGGSTVYVRPGLPVRLTNHMPDIGRVPVNTMWRSACEALTYTFPTTGFEPAAQAVAENFFNALVTKGISDGSPAVYTALSPVTVEGMSFPLFSLCHYLALLPTRTSGGGYDAPSAKAYLLTLVDGLKPGYSRVILSLYANAASGAAMTDRGAVIIDFKAARGVRLATGVLKIGISRDLISGSPGMTFSCESSFDEWVVREQAGRPICAIASSFAPGAKGMLVSNSGSSQTTYSTVTYLNRSTIKWNSSPAYTAPADGVIVGANDWNFRPSVSFAGLGAVSQSYMGYDAWVTATAVALGYDDGWTEWSLDTPRDRFLMDCIRKGEPVFAIGKDLTSNPLASYEYTLSAALPPPSTLANDMPSHPVLEHITARATSADVAAVIDSLSSLSGEDFSAVASELRVTSRIFYGVTAETPFRVPLDVLKQTELWSLAMAASHDLLSEVFIPKDEDDALSVAVTFREAANRCNTWHSKGFRKGVCVAGSTGLIASERLNVVVGVVDGKLELTLADGVTLAPQDDQDKMMAGLITGYQMSLTAAALAHPSIVGFVPVSATTYNPLWDAACLELFGKRYGELTKSESLGGNRAPEWTVEGQLRDGFLKPATSWTPEFWFAVGGTKGWEAENVVGSLVTNPFGVGSVGQQHL